MRYIVSIALALAFVSCRSTTPPPAAQGGNISGPHTHQNLTIFLIHDPSVAGMDVEYLTLEEALKAGAVSVSEKQDGAQVNQLEIENKGDKAVYVQAGDTVKGGQQDRAIGVDFVLPPRSGKKPVNAFCVEPGRWHFRENETRFVGNATPLATKEQKMAAKLAKDQSEVWKAGEECNKGVAGGQPAQNSFVLAVENPDVKKKLDACVAALKSIIDGKPDVVGIAFAINGEMNSAEIYASPALLRKLWPKLLNGCAVEALAKSGAAKKGECTIADARKLLETGAAGEGKTDVVTEGVTVRVCDGKETVRFDCEKDGVRIHRQIMTK